MYVKPKDGKTIMVTVGVCVGPGNDFNHEDVLRVAAVRVALHSGADLDYFAAVRVPNTNAYSVTFALRWGFPYGADIESRLEESARGYIHGFIDAANDARKGRTFNEQ